MQFSLKTLLLFFVVIWSSMAAFGLWGIGVTVLLAIVAFSFRRGERRLEIVVTFWIMCLFACVAVHGHREGPRRSICYSNLQQLGLALHNYHDDYGQFPPAYIADDEGRPMHSWRVLLLPYLDAEKVHKKYRFDEPWDSPNNQKLAAPLAMHFQCPSTEAVKLDSPLATHFVAITGPGTAWPGPEGSKLKDFSDGTHKTIMLVEIAGSDINWMEPCDVTLDEALTGKPYKIPSSHHHIERTYFFYRTHPLIGNLMRADGSANTLDQQPSRNQLAAWLSIDGGEQLGDDTACEFHYDNSWLNVLDKSRCIGFLLFMISMTILVSRPIFKRH